MQVFGLYFFFGLDLNSIKHTQLGDVIENLAAIVLLVLYWVEAEVQLCEQIESLDILQLKHLNDIV